MTNLTTATQLSNWQTQELKDKILEIAKGHDTDSLKAKFLFFQQELAPYFEELSRRNPFPQVSDQVPIIMGVWIPVWSNIPFQDIVLGRLHQQSYQIFHDDGYYANIARYAPGQQSKLWQRFTSKLPAFDLMVLQQYAVQDNNWHIRNIGIFQALKNREKPLTIDEAEEWFTNLIKSKLKSPDAKIDLNQEVKLDNMDRNTVKKFEKAYRAVSYLEHLYIDHDFRLIRSRREVTQRPSYTIAIRQK